MKNTLSGYFQTYTDAAPLAFYRIAFGALMFVSILRFWLNGWIEKMYIEPQLFFSYYGFEWVQPLGPFTYLLFLFCAVSALFIMIGFKYRIASVLFFLSFTYIELMDKTTYLNHYYFISLMAFLLMFLPANAYFSLDAHHKSSVRNQHVPRWTIDALKLMIGIVYFYAGLAKLNSDWLIEAMPLTIWLPAGYDIPLLGSLLQQTWTHYAFSWVGALFDLSIPFLLLWKRSRSIAFFLVVVFHVLTRILFPIGMFPFVMILGALIFFDSSVHHRFFTFISNLFHWDKSCFDNNKRYYYRHPLLNNAIQGLFLIFFAIQILLPFRYLTYPGELFWTEEGYRFSWRVMLMEKAGHAQFRVIDPETQTSFYVDNSAHLNRFQEKQMSFQPDVILEFAHYLDDYYQQKGISDPEIFVDCFVALNGRRSKRYVDPTVDLSEKQESFKPKNWILPFEDSITGL
jgi:hypothetical protein